MKLQQGASDIVSCYGSWWLSQTSGPSQQSWTLELPVDANHLEHSYAGFCSDELESAKHVNNVNRSKNDPPLGPPAVRAKGLER